MTDFIRFTAGGRTFKVELADTPAARGFQESASGETPDARAERERKVLPLQGPYVPGSTRGARQNGRRDAVSG